MSVVFACAITSCNCFACAALLISLYLVFSKPIRTGLRLEHLYYLLVSSHVKLLAHLHSIPLSSSSMFLAMRMKQGLRPQLVPCSLRWSLRGLQQMRHQSRTSRASGASPTMTLMRNVSPISFVATPGLLQSRGAISVISCLVLFCIVQLHACTVCMSSVTSCALQHL